MPVHSDAERLRAAGLRVTLSRNSTDHHNENERIAFGAGVLVDGMDFSDDEVLVRRSSPTRTPSAAGSARTTSRRIAGGASVVPAWVSSGDGPHRIGSDGRDGR
ncbi:catalase [Micromonospora palomenae]|uniref:Catalase n=1 Tax=Micromonospora palomenae TaxID=1461247 RepID=A0A561VNT2_9ACTN|nr:catalase [Micromonospora palomenae]TWG13279.1 catalase [Micromonospora palomenae]